MTNDNTHERVIFKVNYNLWHCKNEQKQQYKCITNENNTMMVFELFLMRNTACAGRTIKCCVASEL